MGAAWKDLEAQGVKRCGRFKGLKRCRARVATGGDYCSRCECIVRMVDRVNRSVVDGLKRQARIKT